MAFYLAGIRFDSATIFWFWQYLDPFLLRERLLESSFYLHVQPPLFNLFLGLLLKTSATHSHAIGQTIYCIMGLAFAFTMFATMLRLNVPEKLAATLTAIFMISPSTILYENWLNYTYPAAFLTCLAMLALINFVITERIHHAVLFFMFLCMLAFIRSVYQPLWFLFIGCTLLFFKKNLAGKILASAVVPAVLILLLVIKNYIVFGNASTSSWLGMSWFRVASARMTQAEKEQLIDKGILSGVSLIRPYSTISSYAEVVGIIPHTEIPALEQKPKTTGFTNYNNLGYNGISKLYLQDTISIIKHRPQYYMRGVVASALIYFRSSSDFQFSRYNYGRIKPFTSSFESLVYWRLPGGVCLFFVVAIPALVCYALLRARKRQDDQLAIVFLIMAFQIVYVTLIGNAFEYSENNRFRYEIEPLLIILFGSLLGALTQRRTKVIGS